MEDVLNIREIPFRVKVTEIDDRSRVNISAKAPFLDQRTEKKELARILRSLQLRRITKKHKNHYGGNQDGLPLSFKITNGFIILTFLNCMEFFWIAALETFMKIL